MSVQAGVWNLDGKPATVESLARISEPATEWGPDGVTTYISGSLGMLYRPFHTTAESRLERQPHSTRQRRRPRWADRN